MLVFFNQKGFGISEGKGNINPDRLRWSSMDLPGLQISMIWANAIICMICAGIQSSLKVIYLEYVLALRPLLAAKNLLPPPSLTVLTLTLKNYPWDLWRTTLTWIELFSRGNISLFQLPKENPQFPASFQEESNLSLLDGDLSWSIMITKDHEKCFILTWWFLMISHD